MNDETFGDFNTSNIESMGSEVKGRILWFDGDSSMSSNRIAEMVLQGVSVDNIFPVEIDKSVRLYNAYNTKKLTLKQEIKPFDVSYNIPTAYLDLKLKTFFLKLLEIETQTDNDITDAGIEDRIKRVCTEIELFKQYAIEGLIKAAIYIIDTFRSNDIVWGTGRGSSCACYCLYLLGLHDVDSVKYNIDLNEFFR